MSDFLRAFAATGGASGSPSSFYMDKTARWHERVPRFIRSLPSILAHSWRTSSCGFKFCSMLSLTLLVCLSISLGSQTSAAEGLSASPATPIVVKISPPLQAGDKQFVNAGDNVGVGLTADAFKLPSAGRRRAPCTEDDPCMVSVVADLDQQSRRDTANPSKPVYVSKLLTGRLVMDGDKAIKSFEWIASEPLDIVGKMAEDGRGMELSELVLYNGSMLAFDDRTGIIFELMGSSNSSASPVLRGAEKAHQLPLMDAFEPIRKLNDATHARDELLSMKVVPVARTLLTEGDGLDSPKGMKIEWACEKNGSLHVGSFGKEYTTGDGKEIVGTANFWIATLSNSADSRPARIDWTDNFNKLRAAMNATFPGYLIHEAVNWSPFYRKWFFLPRRVSTDAYDEKSDEKRGTNKIMIAAPDFSEIHVVDVAFPDKKPERGFSSFKFIPGTNDKHIIALRSAENEDKGQQETYLSIFSVDGSLLSDGEQLVSDAFKFEGLEIW